jgi:hypothetical protein
VRQGALDRTNKRPRTYLPRQLQSDDEISDKDLPPSQRPLYKLINSYLVLASLAPPELVEQYQNDYGEDLPPSLVKLYNSCAESSRFRNGASSPEPYQNVFVSPTTARRKRANKQ